MDGATCPVLVGVSSEGRLAVSLSGSSVTQRQVLRDSERPQRGGGVRAWLWDPTGLSFPAMWPQWEDPSLPPCEVGG